jgi:uncharacterized phage-like protein YoqJ
MVEQLSIKSEETQQKLHNDSCVFTGHRELDVDFSAKKLRKSIEELIKQGVIFFYNGMAKGFDLVAAEEVLKLKKKYPQIKLIACIPCYGQEKYFCEKDKKRYRSILKKADESITLSQSYYTGCMQVRDRYMVERANVMIAYCKKKEGGAAYTVRIFEKLNKGCPIIFL